MCHSDSIILLVSYEQTLSRRQNNQQTLSGADIVGYNFLTTTQHIEHIEMKDCAKRRQLIVIIIRYVTIHSKDMFTAMDTVATKQDITLDLAESTH